VSISHGQLLIEKTSNLKNFNFLCFLMANRTNKKKCKILNISTFVFSDSLKKYSYSKMSHVRLDETECVITD